MRTIPHSSILIIIIIFKSTTLILQPTFYRQSFRELMLARNVSPCSNNCVLVLPRTRTNICLIVG